MNARCDTPTEHYRHSRPKPVERLTEPAPYTPTKIFTLGNADANGALRYPYTPDSSRMLRRSTELASSPIPWDEYSEHSSSPVQNALSSCLAHFENLIQSQEPDEDQMEFIVRQFEAMTSYLSAPDAQTRTTDDHLFSDPDLFPDAGLGITNDARKETTSSIPQDAHDAYVTEVGHYIAGVKKYIQDLKMRLDEVKTLNSIQLDVISDLRRATKTARRSMRSSLDLRDDVKMVDEELERLADERAPPKKPFGLDSCLTLVDGDTDREPVVVAKDSQPPPPARRRVITVIRKPQRARSFWASFAHALDSVGDMLLDY
jgi:hypothetical protein